MENTTPYHATKCHRHDLHAAINGCGCNMRDVTMCVMCGRALSFPRQHTDTCSKRCFAALLAANARQVR